MTFSRTALVAVALATVAGGVYGYWTYARAPLQTASVTSALSPSVAELIVGTWTSADDLAYQVTFSGDGTLAETYGGTATSRGTYRFAASPEGYAAEPVVPDGSAYLLQDIDGERFAYRVLAVDAGSLQLVYLERGTTLSFTR